MVKDRSGEPIPKFVAHSLAGKFSDSLLHVFAKFVVVFGPASETNDRYGRRQFAIGGDIINGGHKLAHREITRRAENHQRAWLWHRSCRQAFTQRVGLCLIAGFVHHRKSLRQINLSVADRPAIMPATGNAGSIPALSNAHLRSPHRRRARRAPPRAGPRFPASLLLSSRA